MAITVKQTIGEHDYVELIEAIDKDERLTRDPDEPRGVGQWPAGTWGTVIGDYGDHKMIDISDERGVPLDMPVVPATKLKLITKHGA